MEAYDFKVETIKNTPKIYEKRNIRMTLDYQEDLDFFENIIGHFEEKSLEMSFPDVLEYLESNPKVVSINWFREQQWKDNQKTMIERINL